jgi:elongation factor 4
MKIAKVDMKSFKHDKIRNFCIIAHIDHGKTTLSNRLLEFTKTIDTRDSNQFYMDKLRVEKERGITVKAQTATMFFKYKGETYLLNLIDTPGHVDFNYEVSRSMTACEGAVLVVDAIKGVQAQTQANWWLAFETNLQVMPVINKVDLPTAQPEVIKQQLKDTFDYPIDDITLISAKTGLGIKNLLPAIVNKIPPPKGDLDKPFKALLFDSWFQDVHNGVICLIKIVDGCVKKGDKIMSAYTKEQYEVIDIGLMYPEQTPTGALYSGQVGYIRPGMRTSREARVGDTFYHLEQPVEALPGFKPAKPMVFAGLYPADQSEFDALRDALEKLTLNDASVTMVKESSDALGIGFRCGFLGLLHMDVFMTRLKQDFGATVIATSPTVPYKVTKRSGEKLDVQSPSQYPDPGEIDETLEPIVNATLVTPKEYMGEIFKLCQDRRGVQKNVEFADEDRVKLTYTMPLNEIISDFYDKLKKLSSGYASFDYEDSGYQQSDMVKVTILLNGKPVDPLSIITHRSKSVDQGKILTEKLKSLINRQMFEIAIQAAIGNKVVARETVKAFRKDVTAKCYGGDVTRKQKLLEKQKEGKKRMKRIGNVELPNEAFLSVFKLGK